MKCKDCKFWERKVDKIYTSVNIYTGETSESKSDVRKNLKNWKDTKHTRTEEHNKGQCGNPKIDYNIEIKKGDELTYLDVECYGALLETGENFGCIHFKKK